MILQLYEVKNVLYVSLGEAYVDDFGIAKRSQDVLKVFPQLRLQHMLVVLIFKVTWQV